MIWKFINSFYLTHNPIIVRSVKWINCMQYDTWWDVVAMGSVVTVVAVVALWQHIIPVAAGGTAPAQFLTTTLYAHCREHDNNRRKCSKYRSCIHACNYIVSTSAPLSSEPHQPVTWCDSLLTWTCQTYGTQCGLWRQSLQSWIYISKGKLHRLWDITISYDYTVSFDGKWNCKMSI